MTWNELAYWKSDDWKKVQEKLDVLDRSNGRYNPSHNLIFHSMELCPFERTRVAIIGQDPYPNPDHCTGLAFSLPNNFDLTKAPSTWLNIKRELCTDLHIPSPKTGSLESWSKQGVLLWNAIPTCEAWKSMSHDWEEWSSLTKELIQKLSKRESGCLFILLGSVARRYLDYVNIGSKTICTSHPSPRGAYQSNPYLKIVPFIGSRIFSTTNDYLRQLKLETVDWGL
jgi:uracil-DNA glycosylase